MQRLPTMIPLTSPAESGIQRNISSTDKENQRRCEDEGDGNGGAFVENLISDRAVQQ